MRNETEGDNLNHTAEQDSLRPEYKTANGRIVYGGGGITPDYIIKSGFCDYFYSKLIKKKCILHFYFILPG